MVEHSRARLFRKSAGYLPGFICHSAATNEAPDDFPFVVRNREFV
jgi:hypothetical protein